MSSYFLQKKQISSKEVKKVNKATIISYIGRGCQSNAPTNPYKDIQT